MARPPAATIPLPWLRDIVQVGFGSSACMEASACHGVSTTPRTWSFVANAYKRISVVRKVKVSSGSCLFDSKHPDSACRVAVLDTWMTLRKYQKLHQYLEAGC